MPLVPDESISSHHQPISPPDRLGARNVQSPILHSRESSARGRAADVSALSLPTLQPQPQHGRRGQSHSKSPESAVARPGIAYEGGLERKSSASYGHHRKTSIVHGIQHSRNTSFANSSSTSVLSPDILTSVGLGSSNTTAPRSEPTLPVLPDRLEQPEPPSYSSPGSNAPGIVQSGGLTTIEDDDQGESLNGQPKSFAHRKMLSNGKAQWDHSRSRSHSKHPHQESKTVGEYALHHLFNSVCISSFGGCHSLGLTTSFSSLARRKVRLTNA
jgi:furry protein family